jgi:uncharacterized membrane protein (DUF485 family)
MAEHSDPPPPPQRTEIFHSAAEARNARIGLWLFALYVALYAGFMWLCAFRAKLTGEPMLGGLNVAVVYGFGLILGAFVLAIVYMWLCGRHEQRDADAAADAEGRR